MKRYNEKIVAAIDRICLFKDEQVHLVDNNYYEEFVNLSDGAIELLINCIVREGVNVINSKILSGEWESDDDICDFVMVFLELMAEGRVGIAKGDNGLYGRLCFWKPLGSPPSNESQERIDEKIESCRALIMRVLWNIILDQENDVQGIEDALDNLL